MQEDGSFQLIRRTETPEDYFATFDVTPFKFGKQLCMLHKFCFIFSALIRKITRKFS